MRLEQTIMMQGQREVAVSGSIQTADQVAVAAYGRSMAEGVLLAGSPEEWKRKHLISPQFLLLSVPLNRIAAPRGKEGIYASSITSDPIIVDLNQAKTGFTFGGVGPSVIVIEGVERFYAAAERGESRIPAWVGVKAAKKLNLIHADHEMSAQELNEQLQTLISKRYPNGAATSNRIDSVPYIVQLYPFELYCIYCYEGHNYRQKFIIAPNRVVSLDGPAQEVIAKFVDKTFASAAKPMTLQELQACACGIEATSTVADNNMAYVHGKKKSVKAGGPGSGPQPGGGSGGFKSGDEVHIDPKYVKEGGAKRGFIGEQTSTAGFKQVVDKGGKHVGYFHESDLSDTPFKGGRFDDDDED